MAEPTRNNTRHLLIVCAVALMMLAFVLVRQSSNTVVLGSQWEGNGLMPIEQLDHSVWTELLARYVDNEGRVDYLGWHQNKDDIALLVDYLETLSRVHWNSARTPLSKHLTQNQTQHRSQSGSSSGETRPHELAFWINAYNALTIRAILDVFPTSSVQRHANPVGFDIWNHYKLIIGSRAYSLDDILNGPLKHLDDPRVHFAIVKGSNSCPMLRKAAYEPATVERQITANIESFFQQSDNLRTEGEIRVHLSPIVQTAISAVGGDRQEQRQFVASLVPDSRVAELVRRDTVLLSFFRHDWSLNCQRKSSQRKSSQRKSDR